MKNPAIKIVTVFATTLCLAFAWNLWAQEDVAAEHAAIRQWQHLALPHGSSKAWNDQELAQQINKLGREGWEMVTVLNFSKDGTTEKTIYYFKKPM